MESPSQLYGILLNIRFW
ncbi:hypothetical protein Pint_21821 [Pistacia integerrima]|uniref:Uncharacterized protein n=2 Tax=Pistacia TaxID=55512 RepID=A0ACC1A2T4_9ROSI|nr:hypothetical protein Pint_21821 [Pistacia integerrima]KAJ0081609.1 hypothetical protein Patl1_12145 [Pistacia atlantica]